MRRVLTIGVACVWTCSMMTACGQSETKTVDLPALQTAMLQADDTFPEMTSIDSTTENADSLFSYLSDMDYSLISGYFMSYTADGQTADEIAVIQTKNASDVATAMDSLKDHVSDRVSMYQTYNPDEVSRAEDALVFSEGNLAVLIISDHQQDVKTEFMNFISEEN